MSPGALWVDTLSVKTEICQRLEGANKSIEILSVNPMCAPSLSLIGQNVAVVEISKGRLGVRFERLLSTWGARLIRLTAQEHDHNAALVQAATHAAILAFGLALRRSNYDIQEAWLMSTPPHRLLLWLLRRIVSGSAETYWDIQAANPYSSGLRDQMASSITELKTLVDSGCFESFRAALTELSCMVEPSGGNAEIPWHEALLGFAKDR